MKFKNIEITYRVSGRKYYIYFKNFIEYNNWKESNSDYKIINIKYIY